MPVFDDCPGYLKCHGTVTFCRKCGDVDLVCDDPACMVHIRERERLDILEQAGRALQAAEAVYRDALKEHRLAEAMVRECQNRFAVMVSRRTLFSS